MKIAKYLHDLGFTVIVAFNPFVKGWTTVEENGKITDELASYGINHFIYQNLHMRQAQVNTFTEYRKNQFEKVGVDLSRYTVRKNAIEEQRYMQEAVINAYKKGYHAIAFGMPFYTDFYDEIVSSLGKCTPSNYFFYNWVIENKKAGDEVTEREYKNILAPYFGEMYNKTYTNMPTYILRWARQVWKGNEKAQGIRTFDELLSLVWNDKRISGSPRNNQLFSVEGEKIFYKGGGRP